MVLFPDETSYNMIPNSTSPLVPRLPNILWGLCGYFCCGEQTMSVVWLWSGCLGPAGAEACQPAGYGVWSWGSWLWEPGGAGWCYITDGQSQDPGRTWAVVPCGWSQILGLGLTYWWTVVLGPSCRGPRGLKTGKCQIAGYGAGIFFL